MHAVVLTIHLLLALALILVVLLQRSEGGGLGIGGGGVMTSRGAATALSKVTWAIGIAFVATSITLTAIAARDSRSGSVIDGSVMTESPSPTAPAAPGLDGDLLPQQLPDQAQAATAPAQPEPATGACPTGAAAGRRWPGGTAARPVVCDVPTAISGCRGRLAHSILGVPPCRARSFPV